MSEKNPPPVSLAARREAPVPQVVEELEKLLERARQGKIRAIAYVVVGQTGSFGTSWTWEDTHLGQVKYSLMAGVGHLNFRVNRAVGDDATGREEP